MARKKTKIDVMETAGLVAGAFAGSQVSKQAPKVLFGTDSTVSVETQTLISSAVPLVVGILGKVFLGTKVKGVFDGMIASGGATTLGTFVNGKIVNGLRSDMFANMPYRNMSTGTTNVISEFDELDSI